MYATLDVLLRLLSANFETLELYTFAFMPFVDVIEIFGLS